MRTTVALVTAVVLLLVRHEPQRVRPAMRFGRPLLSVASIVASAGAMIVISIVDDRQGIAGPQSSLILAARPEHQSRPMLGQQHRGRFADPAAGARERDHLAFDHVSHRHHSSASDVCHCH